MEWLVHGLGADEKIALGLPNFLANGVSYTVTFDVPPDCRLSATYDVTQRREYRLRWHRLLRVFFLVESVDGVTIERPIVVRSWQVDRSSDDGIVTMCCELGDSHWTGTLQIKAERFAFGHDSRSAAREHGAAVVKSPITGTILSIGCADGGLVEQGDVVAVIEAMKMENRVIAPIAGAISGWHLLAGDQVVSGQTLCRITAN